MSVDSSNSKHVPQCPNCHHGDFAIIQGNLETGKKWGEAQWEVKCLNCGVKTIDPRDFKKDALSDFFEHEKYQTVQEEFLNNTKEFVEETSEDIEEVTQNWIQRVFNKIFG